jgi:CHAT domain-containing protein
MKWQYWLWCPLLFCLLVSQHQADKTAVYARIQNDIQIANKEPDGNKAAARLENTLKTVRPLLDKQDTTIALLYHKLGVCYYGKVEDCHKALVAYQEALEIRKTVLGDTARETVRTLNNMAQVYLYKRLYSQALTHFEQAAKFKVHSKLDSALFADILYGMSDLYSFLGDQPKTLEYGYLAMSYFNDMNERRENIPNCLNVLGIAHRRSGQYQEAIKRWQQALDLYAALFDDGGMADCYVGISIMYHTLQKYPESLGWLEKAAKKYGRDASETLSLANVHVERARTYQLMGDLRAALTEARASLSLRQAKLNITDGKHPLLTESHTVIGHILRDMKSSSDAMQAYNQAIASAGTEIPTDLLEIVAAKAKLLRATAQTEGQWAEVQVLYQQADSLIQVARTMARSEDSKLNLAEKARSVYEEAISLAYQYYTKSKNKIYLDKALYFCEQSKATLLLESLQDKRAKQFAGVPDSVLARENDLKMVFSYCQKEVTRAAQEAEKIKAQAEMGNAARALELFSQALSKKYPEYHRLKYQPAKPLTGAQIQENLDSETAFIEYFVGESVLYSVVVTQKSYEFYEHPLPTDFEGTVTALKKSTGDETFVKNKESIGVFTQTAFSLYQLLLEKPLNDLKHNGLNINRLRLVKDGILGYISFETLLMKPSLTNQGRNVPYLLQDYAVSELYSNTLLAHPENRNYTDGFGGFAVSYENPMLNNDATRGKLNPLRYSKKEVREIHQLFGGDTFLDNAATKHTFMKQANRYGILHLTMHGVLDVNNPLQSALVFAQDSTTQDSTAHLLTVAELYATPLKAGLAVLSACNTGNGVLKRGEGIMSLARAFAFSGCQTTVMSLWSIPDESTSEIMLSFYKYLKQGKPKDYALQQAKKDYLNQHQSMPSSTIPNAWAATVVIGDVMPLVAVHAWLKWVLGGSFAFLMLIFLFFKRKMRLNPNKTYL